MTSPIDHADPTPVVHVLHDNAEWLPPLVAALDAAGVPHREHLLDGTSFDLAAAPPEGVFWSRLSGSAHTRGRGTAKEVARATLRWAERHGRRTINGSGVVELEVSKVAQYLALASAGFDVPATTAVFGTADLKARAREQTLPFITKHNQGGKGLGVRRFDDFDSFDAYVDGPDFEVPVDGVTLLQEFLQTEEPFTTRVEFVGGRFVYAVRVDTSAGSFELCPADACVVPDGADPATFAPFAVRPSVTAEHPLVRRLEAFVAEHGIEVAGIEFIETVDGRLVPYDVNTNTNYNPDVERSSSVSAAATLAEWLGDVLAAEYAATPA